MTQAPVQHAITGLSGIGAFSPRAGLTGAELEGGHKTG